MNTREIAQSVGRKERAVRNWIQKTAAKNASVAAKIAVSSPMRPADYTLEETLSIALEVFGV